MLHVNGTLRSALVQESKRESDSIELTPSPCPLQSKTFSSRVVAA
jgi:hypothetical protein